MTETLPERISEAPVVSRGIDLVAVAAQASQIQSLGKTLIASGLLPDGIRKPEAAVAVMLKGSELGIGPMYALSHIAIIGGKPTLSAELMRALVQRAGHKIRVVELTEEKCTIEGERSDDRGRPQRLTFTMADARRANLAGKQVWKHYPKAMLLGRATSALCRQVFADVLAGCSYVPEELGAEVDEEGQVLASPVEPEPEGEVQGESVVEAEVVEHGVYDKAAGDILPSQIGRIENLSEWIWGDKRKVEQKVLKGHHIEELDKERAKKVIEGLQKTKERLEAEDNAPGEAGDGALTDDQLGRLKTGLDRLFEDESDVLEGHEWYEIERLSENKVLADLSAAQADEILTWLDGELAKLAKPDGVKETVDSWDDDATSGEAERKPKGELPATKKQLNYLEALIADIEADTAKFEDMVGKPMHELTREEASEWIDRLSGKAV